MPVIRRFIALLGISALLISCSGSDKNTTSGALDATASKCFIGYVDGYAGLANAYQGVAESQGKAEWGKNHYESHGHKEGRALPDGCVAYLKNTDETWAAYVDSYPDLKAAYEKQKASLGKTLELEKKARWGENHYKTVGFKESRSLPNAASGLGLGNPPPPSVTASPSTSEAEAEEVEAEAEAEPAADSSGAVAETLPTVSLACATASISEDGGTSNCTLTLSKTYSQAVTVTVAYSGSATAGTDYSGNITSHTISAGSTTTSWTITGINDNAGGGGGDNGESDETIVIDIASVTNGTEQDTQTASISLPNICIAPGQAITNNTDFGNAITDWFDNAGLTYGDITQWCTGAVTDMSSAFQSRSSFNEDISGWDTSSVTDMGDMFQSANVFNQPIGNWETASVTDMSRMFLGALNFNQNLNGWNTGRVQDMNRMFLNADAFNQPIGNWDTSSVRDFSFMFYSANVFNQPIGNWVTAAVTDMNHMFAYNQVFNQPIGNWDTAAVKNMRNMFYQTDAFNRPIGNWDTAAVENMSEMFGYNDGFNQDLSSWTASPDSCNFFAINATAWLAAYGNDVGTTPPLGANMVNKGCGN